MAQPMMPETELKAAFLFSFTKFVEWPAGVARFRQLTICVLGDPPVADALMDAVKGQTIEGREIAVSRVNADAGLVGCHVLYLTALNSARSQQILNALKGSPVLTVSDSDQFAETGGIVGLFVEAGKMRFAINVQAAQRARLRISSRLLSLAKLVKEEPARP